MTNYDNFFDTISFVNSLGISFDEKENKLNINLSKAPKLSFNKNEGTVILYYSSPNNNEFGQQSFEFDPNVFNQVFEDCKYEQYVPKNEYFSFDDLFFKNCYPKANHYVQFIFEFFSINPTYISKAIHQKKKMRRKIELRPKEGKILKVIFGSNKKRFGGKYGVKNEKIEVDEEEDRRICKNMELAIQKAAKNYDLSYYQDYQEAYSEKQKLYKKNSHLTIKKNKELFEKFQEEVDKLQKSML